MHSRRAYKIGNVKENVMVLFLLSAYLTKIPRRRVFYFLLVHVKVNCESDSAAK